MKMQYLWRLALESTGDFYVSHRIQSGSSSLPSSLLSRLTFIFESVPILLSLSKTTNGVLPEFSPEEIVMKPY